MRARQKGRRDRQHRASSCRPCADGQTQAAIDAAARAVIARKGILATTISDIATEAGKSTASFYNYYDSKEAMVREWAVRFRDEARDRAQAAAKPGLSNRERSYRGGRRALAHLPPPAGRDHQRVPARHGERRLRTVLGRHLLAADSMITAMVKQAQRQGFCTGDDPHLVAVALVSMLNQFCYTQLSGDGAKTTWTTRRASAPSPTSSTARSTTRRPGRHDAEHRVTGTPGVTREFVGLDSPTARRAGAGGHPCQGLYYRGVGRKPKVAMIATHYQIDFSEHYLADYMATRGIGFLGWNTRFRGFESSFLLDHALVDIGVGVRWLREVQGVETVVLLGNSGGGSLMAAYQAQAVDPNVTPLEGMRPAAGLNELPPADGYVASAAHPGRPDVLTAWMDAAVVDENDPLATDPELDLFDERNGPPYSADFVARYRAAQIARNHAITDWAEAELKRVRAAGFSDRPFTVHADLGRPTHGRSDASSRPSARPTCATRASRSRPTDRRTASRRPARCAAGSACGACGTRRPAPNRTWPASHAPRW